MAIILNGTTGITNDGGYTGDGISFADTTPSNTLVTTTGGNVGVGTASPAAKLDVTTTGDTTVARISNTGSSNNNRAFLRFVSQSSTFGSGVFQTNGTDSSYATSALNMYTFDSQPITFGTNNTERMRIDNGGNLVWGATTGGSIANAVTFERDGTNVSRVSVGGASSGAGTGISLYSSTASAFRFFVSYAGQINATSTSITAISDQSLKENIRDIETGLTEVMALRPRRFDWKEETKLEEKNVAGFIAQEVAEVLPELVYDYQYSETSTKKSLKMGDMLPTLVKAIQEQQAIITDLTTRLEVLEAK